MKRSSSILIRACLVFFTLVALLGMLPPKAIQASGPVVTNTSDNDPGSLRQAIAGADPGDTITFNLPAYPATITLTSGELLIDKDLTIEGPGADDLIVSGGDNSRLFHLTAGTVTLIGLTLSNGRADGPPARGGCIRNATTLTLQQVTVKNCRAEGGDGDSAWGGGIYNDYGRSLTIGNSTLSDNTARGGTGAGHGCGGPGYGGRRQPRRQPGFGCRHCAAGSKAHHLPAAGALEPLVWNRAGP